MNYAAHLDTYRASADASFGGSELQRQTNPTRKRGSL
jgi:hypothetical protein